MATDSQELLQHAGTVFRSWRGELAELFEQGGLTAKDATQFAATLIAASEGAVVLSAQNRAWNRLSWSRSTCSIRCAGCTQ